MASDPVRPTRLNKSAAAERSVINPPCAKIRQLLASSHNVAVVGCSVKPYRESHIVSKAMHRRGLRMIPVNPSYAGDMLWGERIYASLHEVPIRIDIVDVYRRSACTPEVATQAVDVGARALWLQLGIENHEAASLALAGGLMVVQNLCLAVAYTMLLD